MRSIAAFRAVTADLDRLADFYRAIGFAVGRRMPIAANEMLLLGLTGSGERLALSLGDSHLDLDCFTQRGRPYPTDANAADLVFQHLALVAEDATAAWQRAAAAGAVPISRGGPITLPQSSGGVTAVKFRDPDGHPLEFLQFPNRSNPAWPGSGVIGIDHSAISVSDSAASTFFYADLGLNAGGATLNHGPTQDALDGLNNARVAVVPMQPKVKPPHIELLGYCHPIPRLHFPLAADDIAATRVVWHADRDALLRDPDGHLHQLTR